MLRASVRLRRGDFELDAAFELPTPGVVALFGRSGCGKTTLVNVLAGLAAPDAGEIELDGTVLLDTARGIAVPAERRRIGYVFQDARLFPHLRVAANLRYARDRARGPVGIDFDTVVQLLGLAALLSRRCHELSGGERQRVAIGRALLCQPQLLLLDEPLAALDAARRDEVLPYLEALRDRLTIPMVYVSHNFDEVLRLATHLAIMADGRVVAQGELAAMSLRSELRAIVGPDAVGAIVAGEIRSVDAASGLASVAVGSGELRVSAEGRVAGTRLRVQVLARDVIVATQEPQGLSVRNCLPGVVTGLVHDTGDADLVTIDIGGAMLLARITRAASRELALWPGMQVWALVKAVSMRGRLVRQS
jgi:molybdate transport system ATP-binding protein